MPSSATGWMPTGVANVGTPQASASITDSPNPSACDGTSTALAALIQYGTSAGGTRPMFSSRLASAVEPLQRARRIVREQQHRLVRIEPEPLARLPSRDRSEPLQVDAH